MVSLSELMKMCRPEPKVPVDKLMDHYLEIVEARKGANLLPKGNSPAERLLFHINSYLSGYFAGIAAAQIEMGKRERRSLVRKMRRELG